MHKYTGETQNWGPLGPRRLGMEGVADWPPKTSLSPYVLPRPIWSFFFKECSHRSRITPEIGVLGLCPFGTEPWLTPKKKSPSHTCYYVKFGSSASKGERSRRNPKIGDRWGPVPYGEGVAEPCSPSHVLSFQIRSFCVKR